MQKTPIPLPYPPYTPLIILIRQIHPRPQASIQHNHRQPPIAPRIHLRLLTHKQSSALTRNCRDESIAHVARLEAQQPPPVVQLPQAREEPHMTGQLALDAIVEYNGAGDEAEGLADGAIAADVDVDRVVGRVDDVDLVALALMHLRRLAQKGFHVAFVPE